VGILDEHCKNNYEVVAVICSRQTSRSWTKIKILSHEYAVANNKLLQPTNLKDETFIEELRALNANFTFVVALEMLPKVVWDIKLEPLIFTSLLPNYRGAAPINWAIINGETKLVSPHFIDDKIDTGAIILSDETEIEPLETAGELHDRLQLLDADGK
jgi:methionyl-tRNA formyltransferase